MHNNLLTRSKLHRKRIWPKCLVPEKGYFHLLQSQIESFLSFLQKETCTWARRLLVPCLLGPNHVHHSISHVLFWTYFFHSVSLCHWLFSACKHAQILSSLLKLSLALTAIPSHATLIRVFLYVYPFSTPNVLELDQLHCLNIPTIWLLIIRLKAAISFLRSQASDYLWWVGGSFFSIDVIIWILKEFKEGWAWRCLHLDQAFALLKVCYPPKIS